MATRILEILPSELYQITLPLPFELEQVNVHLIRLIDGGWMMVDTGFGNQRSFDLLQESLKELGIEWTDIRSLLLTHLHPDHVGNAERVAALAKPKLWMHGAEVDHLNDMVDAGKPTWFEPLHIAAGTARVRIAEIDKEFEPMRRKLRRVHPDVRLQGGETIEAAIGPLEVIWTPGHSPGHVCLYSPTHRLLFSADTILEDITPNIAWLPGEDTLGDFLASLRKLAVYAVDRILPSHGMPFTGHRAWIEATASHHEERCQLILRGMGEDWRTADELMKSVWDREFSNFHYHFAAGEVLAHLAYLELQGRAQCRPRPDGALEWSHKRSRVQTP